MKTMKDYYNFYLYCDVSLLAEAFEKFRITNLKKTSVMSESLFECPRLKLGCNAWNDIVTPAISI